MQKDRRAAASAFSANAGLEVHVASATYLSGSANFILNHAHAIVVHAAEMAVTLEASRVLFVSLKSRQPFMLSSRLQVCRDLADGAFDAGNRNGGGTRCMLGSLSASACWRSRRALTISMT